MNDASIPLSLLNDYLFCRRRAGLKLVENERGGNVHTAEGDVVHDRADTPGYHVLNEVVILRALPVWSESLGLSGVCDIVERHPDGSLVPVEFKKSRRKDFVNDDVQVCAQGMCLEECLGVHVARGAIFFYGSRMRREVELTDRLRALVRCSLAELRKMAADERLPEAEYKRACTGCSLIDVCLPKVTGRQIAATAWFQHRLDSMLSGPSGDMGKDEAIS